MQTKLETLDNGMRVIATALPSAQTIGISVGVRYGLIDDRKDRIEESHFLEHMLFQGTKKRTWEDINREFKELGVTRNAFTEYETTVYLLQGYKGYFSKMMDLMSDIMINSTILEKELQKERGPMINELLMRHDNPQDILEENLSRVLFKKYPARNIANRDRKTINAISRSDVLGVYERYYGPRNMVISIYGGISTKAALQGAKKFFGHFSKKVAAPKRRICTEKQDRATITESRSGIKQTRIGIGFKTTAFSSTRMKDYLASTIAEKLLDHRLFDEVREKRGLSYDPIADSVTQSTFGFIGAGAGIEKSKIDETRRVILKEFERLQNGEIDPGQFKMIKTGTIVEYIMGRESTLMISIWMALSALIEDDPELPLKMPELLKGLSIDDLRAFCSRYIDVDRYGMFILKPK